MAQSQQRISTLPTYRPVHSKIRQFPIKKHSNHGYFMRPPAYRKQNPSLDFFRVRFYSYLRLLSTDFTELYTFETLPFFKHIGGLGMSFQGVTPSFQHSFNQFSSPVISPVLCVSFSLTNVSHLRRNLRTPLFSVATGWRCLSVQWLLSFRPTPHQSEGCGCLCG